MPLTAPRHRAELERGADFQISPASAKIVSGFWLEMINSLDFFTTPGLMTSPGSQARLLDRLPNDIASLCQVGKLGVGFDPLDVPLGVIYDVPLPTREHGIQAQT